MVHLPVCAPFTRLTLPLREALDYNSSLARAGTSRPSALHAGILPGLSSQRICGTVTASMSLYVELFSGACKSPSCRHPLPLTQTVTSLPAPLQAALSLGRRGRYRCLERRPEHLQSLSFYAVIFSEEACDTLIYGGSNKS